MFGSEAIVVATSSYKGDVMEVSKRDFIQNTSKYLKMAEFDDVVITHHGEPCLELRPIKFKKMASDLKGRIPVKINEDDINTPILEEFDI